MHLLFDFREVFLSKRLVAQKFIEKSGIDGRSNAQLDVRIQLHDGGSQKMRRRMAEDEKRVRIPFCKDLQLYVTLERPAQIDQFAFAVVRLCHASDQRRV